MAANADGVSRHIGMLISVKRIAAPATAPARASDTLARRCQRAAVATPIARAAAMLGEYRVRSAMTTPV